MWGVIYWPTKTCQRVSCLSSAGSTVCYIMWEPWVSSVTGLWHITDKPKEIWCCHGDIFIISTPAMGPLPQKTSSFILTLHTFRYQVPCGDGPLKHCCPLLHRRSRGCLYACIKFWCRRHEIVICWFHVGHLNPAQCVPHTESSQLPFWSASFVLPVQFVQQLLLRLSDVYYLLQKTECVISKKTNKASWVNMDSVKIGPTGTNVPLQRPKHHSHCVF